MRVARPTVPVTPPLSHHPLHGEEQRVPGRGDRKFASGQYVRVIPKQSTWLCGEGVTHREPAGFFLDIVFEPPLDSHLRWGFG